MKQVIVIHGGTTFVEYEDYLHSLTTKTLYPERFMFKPMWKELLQANLGAEYQVLAPSMPNKTNARYSEWKLWFNHLADIMLDDCILVGHSLGAIFLAKYLSENHFPHRIKATILVAAPHSDDTEEDLGDFKLDRVTDTFIQQAGAVTLFFGSNDPVISQAEIGKYRRDIPDAAYHVVPAPDHFVREAFPELTEVIKHL